jgi:hypothetical protein
MTKALAALALLVVTTVPAWADEAPEPVASSPWAAVAMFAVVIGMIAGIIIWRRRR